MLKLSRSWLEWTYICNHSQASSFVNLTNAQEQADAEVEPLVTDIVRLHKELSLKTDLWPCEEIDKLFGELVASCTRTLSESLTNRVMSNPRIIGIVPSLRNICAKAECHLESHWADIISGFEEESVDEESVYGRLTTFPYFGNYVDLTRMELAAIHAVDSTPIRKIAFIGSGSLPLTSLRLCHTLPGTISVLNIDHDPSAISQSQRLCSRLGSKGRGMEFLCSEAGSEDCDLTDFDIVYLAALVGTRQEEKEKFLVDMVKKMKHGVILVVRSAHGLRKVLYPEFDPASEAVARYLDVQIVVHPCNHVVNSVIIARVKGRDEGLERPR